MSLGVRVMLSTALLLPSILWADLKMGGDVKFLFSKEFKWHGSFGLRNEMANPTGGMGIVVHPKSDIWVELENGKKITCQKLGVRLEVDRDKSQAFKPAGFSLAVPFSLNHLYRLRPTFAMEMPKSVKEIKVCFRPRVVQHGKEIGFFEYRVTYMRHESGIGKGGIPDFLVFKEEYGPIRGSMPEGKKGSN